MQDIHPSAWVAPTAQLYGRVQVSADASIWHNAVIRAECHDVRIGRMSNIQDFVMIHVSYECGTVVGEFCSVAHHTTLHGCIVEDHCLVGIGATIMDRAVIGRGSIVAGGAFVKEGSVFPPGSIIAGMPAKVIRERCMARDNRLNAWLYHRNADHYRRGLHRAWDGPEFDAWLAETTARVARDGDL